MAEIIDLFSGESEGGPGKDQEIPWFAFTFQVDDVPVGHETHRVAVVVWGYVASEGPRIIHHQADVASPDQSELYTMLAREYPKAVEKALEAGLEKPSVLLLLDKELQKFLEGVSPSLELEMMFEPEIQEFYDHFCADFQSVINSGEDHPQRQLANMVPIPDFHGSAKVLNQFLRSLHDLWSHGNNGVIAECSAFLIEHPELGETYVIPMIFEGQFTNLMFAENLDEFLSASFEEEDKEVGDLENDSFLLGVSFDSWDLLDPSLSVHLKEYFQNLGREWCEEDVFPSLASIDECGKESVTPEDFERVYSSLQILCVLIDSALEQGVWPPPPDGTATVTCEMEGKKVEADVTFLEYEIEGPDGK